MIVFVGSKNPVKINATKIEFSKAFPKQKIEIIAIEVCSSVSNQPVGLNSVTQGAINRAHNALNKAKEKFFNYFDAEEEIYAVGIEAGFIPIPSSISGYLDYQFCAVIDREENISIASGSGLDFPPKIVKTLIKDPTIELGTIMGEISGDENIKYRGGAIGFYSKGRITRTEITQQSVQMALIPFLNREQYF
jgi:inosine/xanthosine triphosphatase